MLDDLAGSPRLYPQKLDPNQGRVLLIHLSQLEYRRASFLDDRVIGSATIGGWTSFERVERASYQIECARPLHFIFHAGHVGSTLLSRLLDETGGVLGLREPLPLRTIADVRDGYPPASVQPDQDKAARLLETFLRLWSRGFSDTSTVILKATSATARLGSALLQSRPESMAVYLNLAREPYLATLLAGANSILDLRGFAPERLARLSTMIGDHQLRLEELSWGELAAASWLTERLTQAAVEKENPGRVLSLDFDAALTDLERSLTEVLRHIDFTATGETVSKLARSTILTRYSKAPEQFEYSPDFRRALLDQARRDHGQEIRKGLALLDGLGRRHPPAAEVL